MQKITDLAQEMSVFCQQRAERPSHRYGWSRIARLVLGVIDAALLIPPSPTRYDDQWCRPQFLQADGSGVDVLCRARPII